MRGRRASPRSARRGRRPASSPGQQQPHRHLHLRVEAVATDELAAVGVRDQEVRSSMLGCNANVTKLYYFKSFGWGRIASKYGYAGEAKDEATIERMLIEVGVTNPLFHELASDGVYWC